MTEEPCIPLSEAIAMLETLRSDLKELLELMNRRFDKLDAILHEGREESDVMGTEVELST